MASTSFFLFKSALDPTCLYYKELQPVLYQLILMYSRSYPIGKHKYLDKGKKVINDLTATNIKNVKFVRIEFEGKTYDFPPDFLQSSQGSGAEEGCILS